MKIGFSTRTWCLQKRRVARTAEGGRVAGPLARAAFPFAVIDIRLPVTRPPVCPREREQTNDASGPRRTSQRSEASTVTVMLVHWGWS